MDIFTSENFLGPIITADLKSIRRMSSILAVQRKNINHSLFVSILLHLFKTYSSALKQAALELFYTRATKSNLLIDNPGKIVH